MRDFVKNEIRVLFLIRLNLKINEVEFKRQIFKEFLFLKNHLERIFHMKIAIYYYIRLETGLYCYYSWSSHHDFFQRLISKISEWIDTFL
jgi:hypothetical protein